MRLARVALALVFASVACNPKSTTEIKNDTPAATGGGAASPLAVTSTKPATPGGRVEVMPADEQADALSAIRTQRLAVKAQGRVLVVYVSATWCDPCKKFKAEVESGRLDDRLGKITLLAFDADKDVERLGAAGYTFKFVPFVALPGADGHPSDSQQATGKGDNAWRELLGKLDAWQAAGPR